MQISSKERINAVWNQRWIPVIYRRGLGHPLLLRLPFQEGNRAWLRNDRRNIPDWNRDGKYWEIPKAWFNDTVNRSLERWGKVYIIQPHREQEKCAPSCWNAMGHECQCSCMGANHGSHAYGGN